MHCNKAPESPKKNTFSKSTLHHGHGPLISMTAIIIISIIIIIKNDTINYHYYNDKFTYVL